MTYDNIDASGSNTTNSKSSDYRCFRCGVQIYFTSKDVETPSGKPTKDPITGKYKTLDPVTKEYHLCKSSDIETFKETEEYKQRLAQWKAEQQNNQSYDVMMETTSRTLSFHTIFKYRKKREYF